MAGQGRDLWLEHAGVGKKPRKEDKRIAHGRGSETENMICLG
jgi:hypothetical protein